MRPFNAIRVLLPALLLASCGEEGATDSQPASSSSQSGQEYVIGFGETIHVDSLLLEFTTLAEESRCPLSVVCVWEGNARILVTASRGTATTVLELNTSRRFSTSAVFEGHVIELRRLDPYPATPTTGPLPDSYTATLFVGPAAPAN